MEPQPHDIQNMMGDTPRARPTAVARGGAEDSWVPLAPAEFSKRLESVRRTLWLTAAAVLGHPEDAEDVVQEAATIGLQKLDDFQPSTSFAAWMGQIVRNVARNHARKQHRRRTQATDPVDIDRGHKAGGSTGGGALLDADFDARVLEAVNELDEVVRTCLLLRTVRDMPYREISQLLEIPEGTVMSHVHRARRALRVRLAAERDEGRPT